MDLAHVAHRVIVVLEHLTRDGTLKILASRSPPFTGRRVVARIITDLVVLQVTVRGLALVETVPEVSVDHVRNAIAAAMTAPETVGVHDSMGGNDMAPARSVATRHMATQSSAPYRQHS